MDRTPRSLDHFVILVRDIEAAGTQYERMGFHVLPIMKHIELGSCNRVAQLAGTYIELVSDLDKAPHLRDLYLPRFACGDGLATASLTSSDLVRDREAFAAAGLAPDPIRSARRQILMPDGSTAETDSDFMYLWREGRRYASLFVSHHRKPETIWVPEYMEHPNTVVRASALAFVTDDPQRDVEYFTTVVGCPPHTAETDQVDFLTPRGERIEILAPDRLRDRFGEAAPAWCGRLPAYGVSLTLAVADIGKLRRILEDNHVPHVSHAGNVIVPHGHAAGTVLEFCPA